MNRGYTRSEYLRKVAQLREAIPGIALSTDIIVGFPGEGEADFEATTDLVREADFDHLFGFCFSPRPGTPAAGFSGRVDETLARARLERLFELHKQIRLRKHQALVGRVVDVLVEKVNPKDPEGFTGRTRTNKIVHLRGEGALVGKTVRVRIDEGLPNCLKGTVR
jgi:tRNA-2-methylthio-N6-dimethylallyladenosine synthase